MNTCLNNDFFTFWKNLSQTKSIESYQLIQRAIILSYSHELSLEENTQNAAKKILKSFSPITNGKKLANGFKPYQSVYESLVATRHREPCLFGHFEPSVELKGNYVAIRDLLIKQYSPKTGFIGFLKLETALEVK